MKNSFMVRVDFRGRICIPLRIRDVLEIESRDILTLTINEVIHQRELDRIEYEAKVKSGMEWLFDILPLYPLVVK